MKPRLIVRNDSTFFAFTPYQAGLIRQKLELGDHIAELNEMLEKRLENLQAQIAEAETLAQAQTDQVRELEAIIGQMNLRHDEQTNMILTQFNQIIKHRRRQRVWQYLAGGATFVAVLSFVW